MDDVFLAQRAREIYQLEGTPDLRFDFGFAACGRSVSSRDECTAESYSIVIARELAGRGLGLPTRFLHRAGQPKSVTLGRDEALRTGPVPRRNRRVQP